MTTTALTPGFADPPLQAQSVFRLVLDAMARPGRVKTLNDQAPSVPAPLDDATFALALTLLDFETPVWLDEMLRVPGVTESLRFHCGCPIIDQPEAAAFALIGDAVRMPAFSDFAQGTAEYPDRSTTLVIQTDDLTDDQGWTLTGPGIEHSATLGVVGLSPKFREHWFKNRAGSPKGVDLIFTHERRLACLPRTTSLEA